MVSQGPRSILVRVNDVIYGFLRIVCATLFAVMLVAVSVQVFGRYVLLASTPWAEEVSVYCLIWFVLLGASMGVRDNAHFRLGHPAAFLARRGGQVPGGAY